jgi:hypothetical protein
LFALFLISFFGQALTGWRAHVEELQYIVIMHWMWRDNTDFRWSCQEGQPA